jgi:hypothetical protein
LLSPGEVPERGDNEWLSVTGAAASGLGSRVEQPAADGTVTIGLSPGLQAYSFTFG